MITMLAYGARVSSHSNPHGQPLQEAVGQKERRPGRCKGKDDVQAKQNPPPTPEVLTLGSPKLRDWRTKISFQGASDAP